MSKFASLFLACLLCQIAHPFPSRAETAEVKVGVTLGLTGPADKWSKAQQMGLELAVDDLRAEGISISLVQHDSRSEPTQSVSNFKMLVADKEVRAILGDIFSFVTEPLIPLADQNKKLLITPAAPKSLCDRSKDGFFFTTASQVAFAKEAFRVFLETHPEVKRVALVYFSDPGWGYQYRDGWKSLLSERGIELTGEFETAEFSTDFRTPVLKLLAGKPDAFFVAHDPLTFIPAARTLKFKGHFVFANNILEVPVSGASLDLVEGVYFADPLVTEDFRSRFHAKFGVEPLLEPQNAYEALRSFARAYVKNPNEPQTEMRKLQYKGVSGDIDFTESCAGNQAQWHLKQFKGGKVRLIR